MFGLKRDRAWMPVFPLVLLAGGLFLAACDDGGKDDDYESGPFPDGPSVECVKAGKHALWSGDCCSGRIRNGYCTGRASKIGEHCDDLGQSCAEGVCSGGVCSATSANDSLNTGGGHCQTSGDCEGRCLSGVCESLGSGLPRGSHCTSTSQCSGIATCVSFGSEPKICM
jgi:hypothetical protein